MPIYLYIKTHCKTGLKYLGKTTKDDPHEYHGSGKIWLRHLKKHGYNYTTQILLVTEDKEELKETGLFFSNIFGVTQSSGWANLIPEKGDGIDSNTAKEENMRRVRAGIHHWQGNGESQRNTQNHLVSEGTHHFLGGSLQKRVSRERVENGTHNFFFIDRSHVSVNNRKRVEDGTHHFLGSHHNVRMLREGKHTSQNPEALEKIKTKLKERVEDSTHAWVGTQTCVRDDGTTYTITDNDYKSNIEPHVHMNSCEGRRRRGLQPRPSSWNAGKTLEKKIQCPYCKVRGASMGNMKRHHFHNCKYMIKDPNGRNS